jgi:hypothetical protein
VQGQPRDKLLYPERVGAREAVDLASPISAAGTAELSGLRYRDAEQLDTPDSLAEREADRLTVGPR